ncbi:hypothetical protein [Pseudaminobacter sp. NGMCC 1.201702]|uniref:hypothetical protein n=1 Tax=Pseudaminobacter sp. NGMCC 1.201702 TaxID=3391825 RepID=UPI0039EDFDF5
MQEFKRTEPRANAEPIERALHSFFDVVGYVFGNGVSIAGYVFVRLLLWCAFFWLVSLIFPTFGMMMLYLPFLAVEMVFNWLGSMFAGA